MALEIKGLHKTTLIDYPDKVACTIFLPRCNFRCGFCYNKDLVVDYDSMPTMTEEKVLDFLKERKKWLDGVVFTGAEPTLHKELPAFIKKVKEIGYLVKVDTNGTSPERLNWLIDKKLVDYIAMDIKGALESYDKITGVKVDIGKVKESIEILKNSDVEYEFRLTCVPTLHSKEDIEKIGNLLKGSKKMFLQQFKHVGKFIDESLLKVKPFSKEELEEFKDILNKYIDKVEIRA